MFDVCRVTRGAYIEHFELLKKNFFSFPVAVKNSIKVGPLVFLLLVFVITENIMKRQTPCIMIECNLVLRHEGVFRCVCENNRCPPPLHIIREFNSQGQKQNEHV